MTGKRIHRANALTAEQAAKDAEIRERFKNRPTIDQLLASGEYRDAGMTMGDSEPKKETP